MNLTFFVSEVDEVYTIQLQCIQADGILTDSCIKLLYLDNGIAEHFSYSFKQRLKTWLLSISVHSALEAFATNALYKSTYIIPHHICSLPCVSVCARMSGFRIILSDIPLVYLADNVLSFSTHHHHHHYHHHQQQQQSQALPRCSLSVRSYL